MNNHPLQHSSVLDLDGRELAELARLLVCTSGRLEGGFPELNYNPMLHPHPRPATAVSTTGILSFCHGSPSRRALSGVPGCSLIRRHRRVPPTRCQP